jgi:hypothetical protein
VARTEGNLPRVDQILGAIEALRTEMSRSGRPPDTRADFVLDREFLTLSLAGDDLPASITPPHPFQRRDALFHPAPGRIALQARIGPAAGGE